MLGIQSSKNQPRNQYRCDQCAKSHLKCDKNLPSCTTCFKRFATCSYARLKKKDKISYPIEDKLVKYRLQPSRKDKHVEDKGNKINLKHNKDIGINKFRIKKLPKDYNRPYTPIGIFQRFYRKDILENMMTLFQFPSPFKANSGLFLFLALADKLGMLFRRNPVKKVLKEVEKRNVPNLTKLIDKAVDNYFKYNNQVFPIFIRSNFDFHSKSQELKMAIIITGIDHMEKDQHIKYIFDYLSFRLEKLLGVPHRIKPTLENIQALTILIGCSIKLPFLIKNMEKYSSFCQKASDIIGLHLTSKRLPKKERIERNMTYSSLMMIYLFGRLGFGFYNYLPYRSKTLNSEFKTMVNRIKDIIDTKINLFKYDYAYYFSLIMGSYNNDLSSILFSLRILKERHLVMNCINEDLKGSTESLIRRIQGLRDLYLCVYSLVNTKIIQNKDPFPQFDLQNYILFNHHYLMFYIYSLKFYYPSNMNGSVCHNDYLNDKEFIVNVLQECQLCVYHGIQLSKNYLNRFSAGCLTQCLVFLLRHKNVRHNEFNNIIVKGINYIKEMSKIEKFSTYAALNLTLLDFVGRDK